MRVWVMMLLALISCESESGADEHAPPASPHGPSGEGVSARVVRPLHQTTFAEDVAAFESLERCERERIEAMAGPLGDVLADLSYDQAAVDVCTQLAAAAAGDAAACTSLATPTLIDGCRRRVAVYLGEPEHCAIGERSDVTCAAWASGLVPLCAAAPLWERKLCEAVLAHDEARCEESWSCRHAVRRLGAQVRERAEGHTDVREVDARYEGQITVDGATHVLRPARSPERGLLLDISDPCALHFTLEGESRPKLDLNVHFTWSADEGRYVGSAEGQLLLAGEIIGAPVRLTLREASLQARPLGRVVLEGSAQLEVLQRSVDLELRVESYVAHAVPRCEP